MSTYLLAALAAIIPIIIWMGIFYVLRPEKKSFYVWTFIAGCFSPILVLIYQQFWGTSINAIFFQIEPVNFKKSLSEMSSDYFMQNFLVFVFGVGMMEEFVKHFVIRKNKPAGLILVLLTMLFFATVYAMYNVVIGNPNWEYIGYIVGLWATFYIFVEVHKRIDFQSIDQVILAGIMSALGFAFVENIIYVIRVLEAPGGSIGAATGVLVGRSIFVVMIHMLCSGIFGYYYGIALFAGPYLKEHEESGRNFFLTNVFKKVLRFTKKTIFEEEKMMQALVLAMLFHGIYDFILGVNLTVGDLLGFIGIQSSIEFPLFSLTMVAYLFGGYWYLSSLLQEKKNHLKFGLVGSKAMPEDDYNDLITNIKKMEREKALEGKLLEDNWATPEEMQEVRSYISYLNKFKLLEKKYVGTKWIGSEDHYLKLKELVSKVKQVKQQKVESNKGDSPQNQKTHL